MQSKLNQRKTSGNDLATFQLIVDFVTSLYDCFSQHKSASNHALSLYNRLIHNMNFKDDTNILRHVDAFRTYCIDNRENIKAKQTSGSSRVSFTDKIYIDIGYFLSQADQDTADVIWEYILAISAYVDPDSKAKEILQNMYHSTDGGGGVSPQDMMGSMMQTMLADGNGIAQLMGGLNITEMMGNIDMKQLMGSVSLIVDKVKDQIENSDDPNLQAISEMLKNPPTKPLLEDDVE